MSINQFLKEKREALLPKAKYPCACEMKCQRFGGDEACDGCAYCGTNLGRKAELGDYFDQSPDTLLYYQQYK